MKSLFTNIKIEYKIWNLYFYEKSIFQKKPPKEVFHYQSFESRCIRKYFKYRIEIQSYFVIIVLLFFFFMMIPHKKIIAG